MTEHRTPHRAVCFACGQPIQHKRLGAILSPLKAKLFDLVKDAGIDGMPIEGLLERLPIAGNPDRRGRTLNVHINQINDMIDLSGFRIIGAGGRKYLVRPKKALPKRSKDALTRSTG